MKLHITALLAAGILAGCGGGGGGGGGGAGAGAGASPPGTVPNTPEGSLEPTVSLSGATADGYLVGANVCLDTDGDLSCSGEFTIVTTGNGGAFSIDATVRELSQHSLLTEVVEGVTTDSDRITASNPTGVIEEGEGFILSSPPSLLNSDGTAFISPITTLVDNLRADGINNNKPASEALADAQAAVVALLGSDIGLTEDYIAASLSGDAASKAAGERIHLIARVATSIFAQVKGEVEASTLSSEDFSSALSAAIRSVKFSDVVEKVEASLVIINKTNFTTDTQRMAAITAAVVDVADEIDVPDRFEIAGLVEIDKIARVSLTAEQMLKVVGGVWVGEVDREIEEISETATEVNETFTIYFENLGIVESGETSTESSETSTESSETSTESSETSTESSETSTILESGETSSLSFIDNYFLSPLYGLIFEEPLDRPFLAAGGWTDSSGSAAFVVEGDGSVSCDGDLSCTINGVVRIDLEDQDVADTMALLSEDGALWRRVLIDDMSFGAEATGYIANVSNPASYVIDSVVDHPIFNYESLSNIIMDSDLLAASVDIFQVNVFRVTGAGSSLVLAALGDDGVAYFYSGDLPFMSRVASVAYRSFNLNGEAFIEIPSVELSSVTTAVIVLTNFENEVYHVDFEEAENGSVLLLDTGANQALIDAIDGDKLADPYFY
jgi:hypothetical protein